MSNVVMVAVAVPQDEQLNGNQVFKGDEAVFLLYVELQDGFTAYRFQSLLGVGGTMRRILTMRGMLFELSSAMDVQGVLRVDYKRLIPESWALRLTPKNHDVTAGVAFGFLKELAGSQDKVLDGFGAITSSRGVEWVAWLPTAIPSYALVNRDEASFK